MVSTSDSSSSTASSISTGRGTSVCNVETVGGVSTLLRERGHFQAISANVDGSVFISRSGFSSSITMAAFTASNTVGFTGMRFLTTEKLREKGGF